MSQSSITKSGYVQKEIKYVLDVADEQPEGTIFVIPLKLEECNVPERLRHWHWVNLFEEQGYKRLIRALQARATTLGFDLARAAALAFPAQTTSEHFIYQRVDDKFRKAVRETGVVLRFSIEKGYGFIRRDKGGDIFVHKKDIYGFRSDLLLAGKRVNFAVDYGAEGELARDVIIL